MLSVNHARWGQTPEDLRRLAMSAPHPRTRERFLALYEITQQSRGATCVAMRAGRHPQTVMGWLHAYNAHGPDALLYRRTGGRPLLVWGVFCQERSARSMRLPSDVPRIGPLLSAGDGPQHLVSGRLALEPEPSSRIQRGHRPRWTGPIFLTVGRPKGGPVTRPSWIIGNAAAAPDLAQARISAPSGATPAAR
jgi:hypothetical protein